MHLSTHNTKTHTGLHGQLNSSGRGRVPKIEVNCIKSYYKAFPHGHNGAKKLQLAFGSSCLQKTCYIQSKISYIPIVSFLSVVGWERKPKSSARMDISDASHSSDLCSVVYGNLQL